MSLTNDNAVDAHEKHAQNPQRTSQRHKNTDPLYPISTRRPTKHELLQSTSVANQDDRFASDPKKGKYTKEGIDYENEGTVNGSSVNTTGENVCSNISDGAEHTNDSDMKSGKMCDIGTIIAQDNMQQNGDAINKPYLTVTNGSMTTNDKVGNITTLPLQQSDVADSKDTCVIVALALPNNNKAGGNEGVTRKYISDAEVSDVLNPERNPSYADENARRETNRKWPSAANHNIEFMVDAGFFYTGKEDIVRRFFCDICLAEWSNDDDPWEEHARHSPDCPHLKDRKSDEFSSAIQAKWLKVCSPRHQQYTDMMTLESSWPGDVVLQLPKDLAAACFFYTDMLDTIDDTEKAVLIYTRDDGNKDVKNVGTDETSSGDRDTNIDTDPTFNSLRQENRRLKEQVECKICHEEDISFVFIPCGHLVACIECGERALKCIDCNFSIKEKRKIHLV